MLEYTNINDMSEKSFTFLVDDGSSLFFFNLAYLRFVENKLLNLILYDDFSI